MDSPISHWFTNDNDVDYLTFGKISCRICHTDPPTLPFTSNWCKHISECLENNLDAAFLWSFIENNPERFLEIWIPISPLVDVWQPVRLHSRNEGRAATVTYIGDGKFICLLTKGEGRKAIRSVLGNELEELRAQGVNPLPRCVANTHTVAAQNQIINPESQAHQLGNEWCLYKRFTCLFCEGYIRDQGADVPDLDGNSTRGSYTAHNGTIPVKPNTVIATKMGPIVPDGSGIPMVVPGNYGVLTPSGNASAVINVPDITDVPGCTYCRWTTDPATRETIIEYMNTDRRVIRTVRVSENMKRLVEGHSINPVGSRGNPVTFTNTWANSW